MITGLSSTRLRRIRLLVALFMTGLLVSGLTAIPLVREIDTLSRLTGAPAIVKAKGMTTAPAWAAWLVRVQQSLRDTADRQPFLYYGTDWLAFGHIVIAMAFAGAWRDPVRNVWLFDFGLIACLLVIPWAFLLGHVRGIPIGWRLIDCLFGVLGSIPLILCKRLINETSALKPQPR